MLPEVRMLFELVFARMLEDEDAIVGKHLTLEDEVGQSGKSLDGIRGVGKDYVELAVGAFWAIAAPNATAALRCARLELSSLSRRR